MKAWSEVKGSAEHAHATANQGNWLRTTVAILVLAAACTPSAEPSAPSAARPIASPFATPSTPTRDGSATPVSRQSVSPDPREDAVERARADAASRAGVAPAQVRLIQVDAREWGDASLGCPAAGTMYAQVITPGYFIVLEVAGKRTEYHADRRGRVVQCIGGTPA